MAELTVEQVYRGEKYNVIGNAFKELMSLYENIDTLIAAKKMIDEGDSISDILELQLPSLRKEGK